MDIYLLEKRAKTGGPWTCFLATAHRQTALDEERNFLEFGPAGWCVRVVRMDDGEVYAFEDKQALEDEEDDIYGSSRL